MSEVPDVGYSSQLLQARTTILQGAHETLASPANRREYDERLRLGAVAEDVPLEFVAGTLMLLQEAGDAQTVVAVGEAWLSTHRRHRAARDVALATALAHCDLAGALLDARGSVEAACAMLDVAGKLLKEYKAGTPQLQADIEGAVAELRPQMALELLARTDSAESRSKGLELLPAALDSLEDKPEGGRRGDMTRKSFLDALRQVLSAEEQVQLFASAGAAFADTPAELYNAAVAHISAGCAAYDVKLIRRASELLAKAEAISQEAQDATATEAVKGFARDRRTIDERYRRSVAACVAALLLGDSGAAGDALGLRDGRLKCDRQVLAYIKVRQKGQLLEGGFWYFKSSSASMRIIRSTLWLRVVYFHDPLPGQLPRSVLSAARRVFIGAALGVGRGFDHLPPLHHRTRALLPGRLVRKPSGSACP